MLVGLFEWIFGLLGVFFMFYFFIALKILYNMTHNLTILKHTSYNTVTILTNTELQYAA